MGVKIQLASRSEPNRPRTVTSVNADDGIVEREPCPWCGEMRPLSARFCRCGAALVRTQWRSPRHVRRADLIMACLQLLLVVAGVELAIFGIVAAIAALLNRA